MSTKFLPPPIINLIDDDDDDDDVLIVYTSPPAISRSSGATAKTAISVEQYSAADKHLRRRASASKETTTTYYDVTDDEIQIVDSFDKFNRSSNFVRERGESSKSRPNDDDDDDDDDDDNSGITTFTCEICVDQKPSIESFPIMGCTHVYCTDCTAKYVASKLEENIIQIPCPVPDCRKGLLEPEPCRAILPPDVFDRWGNALCEAVILGSEKFYCPFKDCSALLIDDRERGEVMRESECPFCRRLFCVQCKVVWHSGIECSEFQRLNKDEREREDILLMKLAKKNRWTRCPKCRFYVEKSDGCLFMRCSGNSNMSVYDNRCGYNFCYNCGAHMDLSTGVVVAYFDAIFLAFVCL
ncbi:hypothetical protein RJ639_041542 [Escallonia herrerae]|uniref:RBR-type E3 ubiquitin transferase n=1 Tax=Escallonia herrerae TaxID=1293975 RepID=A0AA88WJ80_9ASTE|nr:hypothetical protein RJ639_041542 [Escallonia herrerae]